MNPQLQSPPPVPSSDEEMGNLILSTWSMLHQQSPPPSLREILGAYNQKGNGDREMLLAMLNAKSAEDQRLASLVQLHQTLLQTKASPSIPIEPTVSRPAHPHMSLQHPHAMFPSSSSFLPPPSPTSMSHSSGSRSSTSMSPRSHENASLTLPPITSHLAGLDRTTSQKRRRMDTHAGPHLDPRHHPIKNRHPSSLSSPPSSDDEHDKSSHHGMPGLLRGARPASGGSGAS